MTTQMWIEVLPYLLIVFGMFFEGEMVLISTTIAGHQGYIDLFIAIPCAITGTFLADMTHFYIGRKGGRQRVEKNVKWKSKSDQLEARLNRSPFLALLGIRFMYGFRVLAPIIVGMTGMSAKRFSIFSIVTILIWTTIYVGLGLAFGELIQNYLQKIEHIEKYIIGVLILIGIIISAILYLHRNNKLS